MLWRRVEALQLHCRLQCSHYSVGSAVARLPSWRFTLSRRVSRRAPRRCGLAAEVFLQARHCLLQPEGGGGGRSKGGRRRREEEEGVG